jgi:hypothetical protein
MFLHLHKRGWENITKRQTGQPVLQSRFELSIPKYEPQVGLRVLSAAEESLLHYSVKPMYRYLSGSLSKTTEDFLRTAAENICPIFRTSIANVTTSSFPFVYSQHWSMSGGIPVNSVLGTPFH